MTCDFMSSLTVFQSYQDDVRMIMKGCVQWNFVYGCNCSESNDVRFSRRYAQCLTSLFSVVFYGKLH